MIETAQVLRIHEHLIAKFGGSTGVRDMQLLESALARPFMTFDQSLLYQTPIEKAAAILESILVNHPFLDGNKRIGYFLMRTLLLESGYDIKANADDTYHIIIEVASGKLKFDDIVVWLQAHHVVIKVN